MPVSETNSQSHFFTALKESGVRLISVLPETWLVHMCTLAEEDDDVTLVRLAKEEEGIGNLRRRSPGGRLVSHADAEPRPACQP